MKMFDFQEMKKGQVTIFIILGVLLLLLVMLFFLFRPRITGVQEIIEVPLELQPVYGHVDDCLKQTSILGLQLLGAQGGVIFVNGSELSTYYGNISYGYYEGRDVFKSISFMENEVSRFLELALPNCVDFNLFNNFNISAEDVSVETKIIWNEVIITVTYPIHAATTDYEGNIDRFIYHAPIRLGYIHDAAKSIVNRTKNDPDNIDMSYLVSFRDVNISFIPFSDSDLVYTITDDSSKLNGLSYLFMFANKFVVNQKPELHILDTYFIDDGTAFLLDVNATDPENDDLSYYDDTALFDITEDGIIAFPAEIPGNYDVTIRVEDEHYNYDESKVRFVIR